MDIRVELKNLVGKVVAVDDQTRAKPRVFIGPLVDEQNDDYSVVDQQDGIRTSFGFHHVTFIQGTGITLESPEGLNEAWEEDDESDPDQDDESDEFGYHPGLHDD